jgi:hypothetical protein
MVSNKGKAENAVLWRLSEASPSGLEGMKSFRKVRKKEEP